MQPSPLPPVVNLAAAQSDWPLQWARGLLHRWSVAERSLRSLSERPTLEGASDAAEALRLLQASGVAAGFDAARSQYAASVQAGLIERSLLASGAFERSLGRLERLILGPWARTV